MKSREVRVKAGVAGHATITGADPSSVFRAITCRYAQARLAFAALGKNLNHTANRFRTIEAADVAAHHFDSINLIQHDLIKCGGADGCRIRAYAIDQHQRVVGIRTAHKRAALFADAAGLRDFQRSFLAQQGRQIGGTGIANLLWRDQGRVLQRLC